MKKQDLKYNTYVQILKEELIPATGCTEPIAIAYASAKAREVLGALPESVLVEVSGNIIKNVKSVVVPNTGGMKGIEAAAIAGIVGGNADKKLEVISDIDENQKRKIRDFLSKIPITVNQIDSGEIFDILVTLADRENNVSVRISRFHTNIVSIVKNGRILYSAGTGEEVRNCDDITENSGLSDKSLLNLKDIIDFADTCDLDDVRELLDLQIRSNYQIAEEGIRGDYGANIGSVLIHANGNAVQNRAAAMAAAGSDARMSGCELPVIINSGSGNQGITVSVPVVEYAKELNSSEDRLYRALLISNLTAVHEKTGIGRLSAYCGAVSAGCAAGCGIAYLQGEGYEALAHTLVNSLAVVSGIICDGAKPSCAAKIASSVQAGILGYQMWKDGQEFKRGDGIVNSDVEATIVNVGRLGREGMRETDKEIVSMMLDK